MNVKMPDLKTEVIPWIEKNAVQETVIAKDGVKLNTYHMIHPEEKAAIVIVHGFCGFFGKYHEAAYLFYHMGYSVFFLNVRGHGGSGNTRSFEDHRVTVGSFEEYVEDLNTFLEDCVKKESLSHKYFLYCHSMGGAIGGLYIEKYPDVFTCAVMSAPMMQMNYGNIPNLAVDAMSVYSKIREIDDDYAPTQHGWTGEYAFENSADDDEELYRHQFEQRVNNSSYQTWGGTWAWTRAAKDASEEVVAKASSVTTPILLFQAGRDTMVKPEGHQVFRNRSHNTTLLRIPDSKHEIYAAKKEVRAEYYDEIRIFFDAH